MIRVVMLLSRLDLTGGAERAVTALAASLPADRFEVSVCAHRSSGGVLADRLDDAGIRHFSLERSARYDIAPFRRLTSLLRAERVDVLHSHIFNSNVWGALIGRACRVPAVIAQEHGSSYESVTGAAVRLLDGQLVGRLADSFVVGTVAERDRVVVQGRVPADKVEVIPAPYVPRRSPPGPGLRPELGVAADVPVVGTAAMMRPEKRLDVLVEAFALVRRRFPAAVLVLAGDGPSRPSLERLVERRGLEGSVHLLGMREDVDRLLEAIDVAVISSERESTPLFAFECMAHSTPLVSTRVGEQIATLSDDESVVLAETNDPRSVAAGIAGLLADPARRRSIAAEALTKVRPFELESVVPRYAGLYQRLLAEARRR